MAKANPPSAITQYKVVYTIRDGDNEYECTLWQPFDSEPTELECAQAVIASFSEDKQMEKECLAEFKAHGYFTIPYDYRIASQFGAEPWVDRYMAATAHEMLRKLKQYSSDCATRLEILRAKLTSLGFNEAEEEKNRKDSDARDL